MFRPLRLCSGTSIIAIRRCTLPTLVALQPIGPLTGTSPESPPMSTLYSGDLAARGPQTQRPHAYLGVSEDAVF